MSFLVCLAATLLLTPPPDSTITLGTIQVQATSTLQTARQSSMTTAKVSRNDIQQQVQSTLAESLQEVSGVQAMTIGSGQSRLAIRGLSFSRMAVMVDGAKHQAQQWGDDHGLEIDQSIVDRIEVIKGPASLFYGSDAIGGVASLLTLHPPIEPMSGSVQITSATNNGMLGLDVTLGGTKDVWHYRVALSISDFGDYGVNADSIQYHSYNIPLKDRQLRNTAGTNAGAHLLVGYADERWHSDLRISDSYSKAGFFANAHGMEVRLSKIDYDRTSRDIDLPYQLVNHLRVQNNTTYLADNFSIETMVAYQNNQREEHSEPVAHGYMPRPDGSLERRFNKNTISGSLSLRLHALPRHSLQAGVSAEYQHNRRDGWGFIIPDFERGTAGAFMYNKLTLSQHWTLNGGIRYDHAMLHTHSYTDWFISPRAAGDSVNLQRATSLWRQYNSLCWGAGAVYSQCRWVLKANIGKSFRTPEAKEMGSDGINYHLFRYERGNADLNPEESYQADMATIWDNGTLMLQVEPYYNFFPNYIYLNPTPNYVEGMQLYHYTQAQVMRCGIDMEARWHISSHWEGEVHGEYLYARQLSGAKKGYGLPFSPPANGDLTLRYKWQWHGPCNVALNVHGAMAQYDIVPPEHPTDGYCTINMMLYKEVTIKDKSLRFALRLHNLLNTCYYNHASYYRLIDVPEPGRSLYVMLAYHF